MKNTKDFSNQDLEKLGSKYKIYIAFVLVVFAVLLFIFKTASEYRIISSLIILSSLLFCVIEFSKRIRGLTKEIDVLRKENSLLEEGTLKKELFMKKRAISGLLEGNIPDEAKAFLPVFNKKLCVIYILFNSENSERMEYAKKLANELFSEIAELSFAENLSSGKLSFIAELSDADNSEWVKIEKTANQFIKSFRLGEKDDSDVVYGKICDTIEQIPESYKRIKEAAILCNKDGCVINADKIARRDYGIYNYTIDDEIGIIIYIKKGDFAKAYGMMSNALDEVIYQHSYPTYIIKCFVFELAGTILKAVGETEKENGIKINCCKNINEIFYVDSVNDMEYILKECLKEACNLIAESNKGVASPFCEKIKKYVKEHYNDIDMNVNAIAANFYINPAYLSNMFKRNTDMKLLDYINKVRIEEAKKLLMSKPDISIEELSEKSGFKNSRTFRRIFTKYEDVSPSKFTKSQDVERNDPVKEEF